MDPSENRSYRKRNRDSADSSAPPSKRRATNSNNDSLEAIHKLSNSPRSLRKSGNETVRKSSKRANSSAKVDPHEDLDMVLETLKKGKNPDIVESQPSLINAADEAKPNAMEVDLHSPIKAKTMKPFTLPSHFQHIQEDFRALETFINAFHGRRLIDFATAKQAVERATSRAFELDNLSRILTAFPECYNLEYKKLPKHQDSGAESVLVIQPPVSSSKLNIATSMLQRRKTIDNNLLNMVKSYHQNFLKSIGKEDYQAENDWHPDFQLNEIPQLELTALPSPPVVSDQHSSDTNLDKSKALDRLILGPNHPLLKATQNAPKQRVDVLPELRGIVDESLIAKIEENKLRKDLMDSYGSTEQSDVVNQLAIVADMIWSHFSLANTKTLRFDLLIDHLAISHPSSDTIKRSTIVAVVEKLLKMSPRWLKKVSIGGLEWTKLLVSPDQFASIRLKLKDKQIISEL